MTQSKKLKDLKTFVDKGTALGLIKEEEQKKILGKIKEGVPADKLLRNVKRGIGAPIEIMK